MDPETGEYYADNETGETTYGSSSPSTSSSSSPSTSSINVETGESEDDDCVPRRRFRVPSSYYTTPEQEESKICHKLGRLDKREWELITAAIFLLPTMILFYPVLSIFALVLEIFLHNWSHRQNRYRKCGGVYYQSPLHGIAKEFCGRCKIENEKVKITKIQDMRNDKLRKYGLEYIRRVVT